MMTSSSNTPSAILEDDQQLYDWGIENRLDQYYQDDHNGENFVPPGQQQQQQQQQQYYPRDYSSERREPPPAHLPPPLDQPPSYRQERRIKEEPGLDMSQWSHPTYHQSPYYRKMAPSSPGNFPPAPPFSLDANEAMKVERKRARNRIAASKCRMRKIEKIQTLDQQTSKLQSENDELAGLAKKLKEQNYKLQQELRWHINNGCQLSERATKATELLTESPPALPKSCSVSARQVERPDSTTVSPSEKAETESAPR